MKETDVIVVGGGIFGCTIARELKRCGRSVTLITDNRPLMASAASGCLVKPSWLDRSMTREQRELAFETLERHVPVRWLQFEVKAGLPRVEVGWYPRHELLRTDMLDQVVVDTVSDINYEGEISFAESEDTLKAKTTVVAAGFWSGKFRATQGWDRRISGKTGVSFELHGNLPANRIIPWAPFKQVVAYQADTMRIWAGDGGAIKPENWDEHRLQASKERVEGKLGFSATSSRVGIRPMAKGEDPCLVQETNPGVWIATGGGKIGTAGAGWAAAEIERRTR